jgi:hypothetical protein
MGSLRRRWRGRCKQRWTVAREVGQLKQREIWSCSRQLQFTGGHRLQLSNHALSMPDVEGVEEWQIGSGTASDGRSRRSRSLVGKEPRLGEVGSWVGKSSGHPPSACQPTARLSFCVAPLHTKARLGTPSDATPTPRRPLHVLFELPARREQ